jgi:hypothetical protein
MPRKKRTVFRTLLTVLFLFTVVLGLSSDENWLRRAIASALLLLIGLTLLIPGTLSRRYAVVPDSSRIAHRHKLRLTVEIIGRLLWVAVIVYIAPIFFNMCLDFRSLVQRGSPVREKVTVIDEGNTGLFRWIWNNLDLQSTDGTTQSYQIFYHPVQFEKGHSYEAVILPRSKCVLSMVPRGSFRRQMGVTH